MNPIEWLCRYEQEFNHLSHEERDAIMHFSLLWSLFECKKLGMGANTQKIKALAEKWVDMGQNPEAFVQSLAYFQNRYLQNNNFTDNLGHLHPRQNADLELVKAVLCAKNGAPADIIAALFIIIYRLRNNLFHGAKWAYHFRDQLDNFNHANIALMAALEIQGDE
ncbi:hypothetical protein [Deefgea rivuli]|uniref:hypothetical protein n=1 Tax=Deefgea rivuli TaxID=400948 RepID=UPI0005666B95|nr:hypothetical protein [Deefgea rivuli]